MPQIAKSLERFSATLERGEHVVCDQKGNWSIEGKIQHAVRWLKGGESARLEQIANAFCKALDDLEKTSVVFSDSERLIDAQYTMYQPYIKVADQIIHLLETKASPKVQNKTFAIRRKVQALKYRLENVNGGVSKAFEMDSKQFERLTGFAIQWKKSQKLITDKSISARDLEKIKEACHYPEFANLVEKDAEFRHAFFQWALKDNCDVQLFVEFPATVARLKSTYLYSRISRLGERILEIVKEKRPTDSNSCDKMVKLPFYDGKETKYYNILDESQVVGFSNDITASIKEVFDVFKEKDYFSGNFEMFNKGIANWNYQNIGPWNKSTQSFDSINLEKSEWWTDLPSLTTASKEELEETYDVKLQPGEWLTCAMGARKSASLDLNNAHGYLKLFIPTKDGSYQLYTFGKLAVTFPRTLAEFMKVLVSTKEAKIVYPDENIFYFFRQHANYPIVLSSSKGEELMSLIKHDIMLGREGNLVFQFSGENCAEWVQNILERLFHDEPNKIPNLFVMPLLEAQPENPILKGLFTVFKKAPKNMHPYLLNGLARMLGSSAGLTVQENGQQVFKTTRENPHRYQGTSFQPAHLHREIETGRFKGVLATGY